MELIGSGRNADVFAVGDGRVPRRYRDGSDVAAEAAVMAHVAAFGYPVPRVYRADGPDLVMDRVDGPTMLEALAAGTLAVDEGARLLANLHERRRPYRRGRGGIRTQACCTWTCTPRTSCWRRRVPSSSTGATPRMDPRAWTWR